MSGGTPSVLIVDGYNVLNAWRGLLASKPLSEAREDLIHALADYSGYTGERVILVFDAWKSERNMRTEEQVPATLSIVYTKRGETADAYIERLCEQMREQALYGRILLRVATSDQLEQVVTMGRGAIRISARELLRTVEEMRHPAEKVVPVKKSTASTLMDRLPPDVREKLERMRRGEETNGG